MIAVGFTQESSVSVTRTMTASVVIAIVLYVLLGVTGACSPLRVGGADLLTLLLEDSVVPLYPTLFPV
jgi:hypothetical protein